MPRALVVVEHVDGVLDRGGVRGPGPERREGAEPHDVAVVDRHHRGVTAGVLVDPLHLLVERAGDEVEE